MSEHILSLSYGKDSLEDEGIVNPIHPFRWAMLDGDVQLRF